MDTTEDFTEIRVTVSPAHYVVLLLLPQEAFADVLQAAPIITQVAVE